MGAGKSLQLLVKNHFLTERDFVVSLMKPAVDTRSSGTVKSRIGLEEHCHLIDGKESVFAGLKPKTTHVLVDEGQFLTVD